MNTIDWATLDPAAPLDDLEPLRDLVAGARVVAVGEAAHHVREFYLFRHRMLRFLVERCGFTVYGLEAPYAEGRLIDAWVQGGAGTVEDAAARGVDHGMGDCQEMYDTLAWLREHNRAAERPVRFAGCLAGSTRGSLEEVVAYLREADPDALPMAERAHRLAGGGREVTTMKLITDHARLAPEVQDELTALISRLVVRMETMAGHQNRQGRAREHAEVLHHLRNAWYHDHSARDFNGRGLAVGSACIEAAGAATVMRLLENGERVVLAAHNTHIRKTAIDHDGDFGLFPQGYLLAQELGEEYVSIAATSVGGRTAAGRLAPEHPDGYVARDTVLPPLTADCVETAFGVGAALSVADLRGTDPGRYRRIRMLDHFMDLPVAEAYDAVACVPETRTVAGFEEEN
ncbi:erythromycin esterase family protein [Nonomuraea longicatena]|uniref:Erythromycin esterase family protein n=1 Tax=Nonomuraea longicatena TaxID=83682 RepID=A0ABN1PN18_9ACTN